MTANTVPGRFPIDGYVVIDEFLSAAEIAQVTANLDAAIVTGPGDCRFLDREWCRLLAHVVRHRLLKRRLMPIATQPVLCIHFTKGDEDSSSTGLHRDLHVPLAREFAHARWADWHDEQGIALARAPRDVLSNMLVARIHIDACAADDGALAVVPGSHTDFDISGPRVACTGAAGSALIMSPLLLRESPRASGACRVLHFVFGPTALPDGAAWYYAP